MDKEQRAKDILQLWATLKTARSPYEAGWKDITRFCSPERDFWSAIKDQPQQQFSASIYDGTPLSALSLLANGLQGYMASKSTRSFKATLESHKAVKHQPFSGRVRRYMQEVDEVLYWMINKSNFYDAVNEIFRIGGSIATTSMFIDLVPDGSRIVNVVSHPNDVWIAQNDVREVDTVFRTVQMTAKDIVRRWENELDDEFKAEAKLSPYKTHEILHAVLPRDTRDATKIDNLNKPFASYWLYPVKTKLLSESGFDANRYISWRWSTPTGGTYGWGPAHNAMADVLRSNQVNKSVLEAAHLALYPALNVPQERQGRLNLNPKGVNPYTDPSRVISPVNQLGSFPIARDREEALEKAIRDHFFVDMFLMLNQSAAGGKRTATEVMEMQAEKAAIMGAITTRIESEFFDPMFDIYFEIAQTNGWLPVPPPELYDILGNSEVKIDYIGPMSQIQQRFYQKQAIIDPMMTYISLAQYFPGMLDIPDPDKLGRHVLNGSFMPEDIIRTQGAVDQIRAQKAQMQQAQMQAEQAQMNSQSLKNMSDINPENLQALANGATGAQA